MEGRLLVDGPGDGAWNMAVDQALLDTAVQTQAPVLRLYRWSEPTLSLGYFQQVHSRDAHASSRTCPMLRRSTGGGAILHDRELTYSLVVPPQNWVENSVELYTLVHLRVARLLAEMGLTSLLHPEVPLTDQCSPNASSRDINGGIDVDGRDQTEAEIKVDPRAFLCFLRRSVGDLIVWRADGGQGRKVLGSAQRKAAGCVLQHGSLLLERSPFAPELPGVNDFLPKSKRLTAEDWTELLQRELAGILPVQWSTSQLTSIERELADQYVREKFKDANWTNAR